MKDVNSLKKDIPLFTFVYEEQDDIAILWNLPLLLADSIFREKQMSARILYRIDYIYSGQACVYYGVCNVTEEKESLLEAMEKERNGFHMEELLTYLKAHQLLCGLENLAKDEILALKELEKRKQYGEMYLKSQRAFYDEISFFIKTSRDIVNADSVSFVLPAIPDKGTFMKNWFRNHQ